MPFFPLNFINRETLLYMSTLLLHSLSTVLRVILPGRHEAARVQEELSSMLRKG